MMDRDGNLLADSDADERVDFFNEANLRNFGGSEQVQVVAPEIKAWDMFRVLPPEEDHNSAKNEERMTKILRFVKVVIVLLVFFIVLGGGIVAKGTILFMTSQLSRDQVVNYCNQELDINREKTFVAKLEEKDMVAWCWMIFVAVLIPEGMAFLRALRISIFKSMRKPEKFDAAIVLVMETCSALGVAMLAFSVLPDLDVVKAAMLTNCVCFVPAVLALISEEGKERNETGKLTRRTFIRMIMDTLAMSAQVTGFVVWPLVENRRSLWLLPLAVLLTSCGWWENYVTPHSSLGFIKSLGNVKERLKKTRYSICLLSSVWKMIITFLMMMLLWHVRGGKVEELFSLLVPAFEDHPIYVYEVRPLMSTSNPGFWEEQPPESIYEVIASIYSPLWVLLVQVCAAYFTYITGKYACRIMIQGFSYAFPVTVTVPLTISLLVVFCGLKNSDPCAFHGVIPDYMFFRLPPIYFLLEFLGQQYAWIWLAWLGSQVWISSHIWWPKCERLASTEKLFVSPMYCGLMVDQSLALNRRIDDQADIRTEDLVQPQTEKEKLAEMYMDDQSLPSDDSGPNRAAGRGNASSDGISRIFACATMWHETKDEMMEMLKSIFRMDEDQSARRVAQKYLQVADPDYYEFETHIFFDDAYDLTGPSVYDGTVVNSYVKQMVNTIDEAASHVHETHVRLRPPKKFPTPYGGKLVWTLPGKTKLNVHLKDKHKIRHKKRWSQVMYMYYLLGHRLMELPIPAERKEIIAENTYILALDGDIDFQPSSVQLLVDLMKKNRQLGAACGRIHPVGSGAMVWYQRFEYAVGHWLQKATEHVIGCVLCSPGCFSLFRGKALMDDNVMCKYTARSEEARHYVQYDQGEDRWLCTLLLQRGYRVEYSAASDAYTHCPEGFNEFYNQRRRWVPSTMANIMDLLGEYKQTVYINDNISVPYISYQMLLLVGSVLGPGTILLMLMGAFVAAFKMDQWSSFGYNIAPVIFFMIICYFAKTTVLVGIMMQITEDGPLAPSSLFFFIVTGQLVVTALLHPIEIGCLPFGVVYYITVPSMYMLLIIYSLFNLNNVSWGTRENPQAQKTQEELTREAEEAARTKDKKKEGGVIGFFKGLRNTAVNEYQKHEDEGSIEFSLGGLFKCMCCAYPRVIDEKQQLVRIADTLEKLNHRIENIEKSVDPHLSAPLGSRRRSLSLFRTSMNANKSEPLGALAEATQAEEEEQNVTHDLSSSEDESTLAETKQERDDLVNPYWMEDPDLKKGEVEFIASDEQQFWKDLIDKYLYPLDKNAEEQRRVTKDLKQLRDKSVFGFFMLNAMFVMILFLIQLNKDILHLDWPLGVKSNFTFNYNTEEIMIWNDYLQLDPIGMVFLLSFAFILLIQFIAMLFHRFQTLSHILAATELGWYCTKKVEDISTDALIDRHAVEIARELQKLKGIEEEEEMLAAASKGNRDSKTGPRRFTIVKLERDHQRRTNVGSLANAFERRFLSISQDMDGSHAPALRRLTQRRGTIEALQVRRDSILAERRRSMRLDSIASSADGSEASAKNNDIAGNGNKHVQLRRNDSIVSWRN
ncbi:hypothetical protein B566_EDAN015354 [Ephemera danica]|nr:hypothetical protein B566_EDAN015354 [Ephemera danica]